MQITITDQLQYTFLTLRISELKQQLLDNDQGQTFIDMSLEQMEMHQRIKRDLEHYHTQLGILIVDSAQ